VPKNLESKDIDQLLAEADELIQQINSNAIKDMEEEHRIQYELIRSGNARGDCGYYYGHEELRKLSFLPFVNRLGKKMAGQSGNRICFDASGSREICINVEIMHCLSERSADTALKTCEESSSNKKERTYAKKRRKGADGKFKR
jgi:hypothetical protein